MRVRFCVSTIMTTDQGAPLGPVRIASAEVSCLVNAVKLINFLLSKIDDLLVG